MYTVIHRPGSRGDHAKDLDNMELESQLFVNHMGA